MTVEEAIKEFNKEFFRDEIDSVYLGEITDFLQDLLTAQEAQYKEALEERLDTISEREDTKYIEILRMKHIIDDVLQTMKEPMNTTKTELLEEFRKEFIKDNSPDYEDSFIDANGDGGRAVIFFSEALDRYRDSVREEDKEKIEKLDAYYVLNGSIEKHKGGHLLDKDDVLKILND